MSTARPKDAYSFTIYVIDYFQTVFFTKSKQYGAYNTCNKILKYHGAILSNSDVKVTMATDG